jgi:hypothetical protein
MRPIHLWRSRIPARILHTAKSGITEQRILKYCKKILTKNLLDPISGIGYTEKFIPDPRGKKHRIPEVKKTPDRGSRIWIRNTAGTGTLWFV